MNRRNENKSLRRIGKGAVEIIIAAAVIAFGLGFGAGYWTRMQTHGNGGTQILTSDGLSVHFLELGNQFTGDSVLIDYGETEILIDAGSKFASAPTLKNYINNYVKDGEIEYVIATHSHEDHIAAFCDTKDNGGGILTSYDIGTLIDFPLTNAAADAGPTTVIGRYRTARQTAIDNGTKHYSALQCYREQDGAKRVYSLGEGVSLEILYNFYYENTYSEDENNYSVCTMLHNGDQQYLFTGDMEFEGEEKLVEYYEQNHGGLGHCTLFKGAHHGSNTSNREVLLNEITPEYVCICTCAGSSQYTPLVGGQFPTQNTIENIAKHTDNVYITTLMITFAQTAENAEFTSMNGNIKFSTDAEGNVTVTGSNNSTKLKDTEWFKSNRETPPEWQQSS